MCEFLVSSQQIKDFYTGYLQLMYFGRFFFPCVDYTVVFNYSNTGIEIILCVYNIILQGSNQEEFTSGVYMLLYILYIYTVITFVCTTSCLFPSPLMSCFKINLSSYLVVWNGILTILFHIGGMGYLRAWSG